MKKGREFRCKIPRGNMYLSLGLGNIKGHGS